MEKFLLSLLCLLTVGFAGQAETSDYQLCTTETELYNPDNQFIIVSSSVLNNGFYAVNSSTTQSGITGIQILTGSSIPELISADDQALGLGLFSFIADGDYKALYETKSKRYYGGKSSGTDIVISQELPSDANSRKFYQMSVSIDTKNNNVNIESAGTTSRNFAFQFNNNKIYFKNYAKDNLTKSGYSKILFYKKVASTQEPTFPTECAKPVFTIDGLDAAGENLIAYVGSKIAVSCATKDSNIVWSVTKGNDQNSINIEGEEYEIPADAMPGDKYTFDAIASVQGETEILTADKKLELIVIDTPNVGYFYTPAVKSAPAYGTKLMNASREIGGSNNTKTTALCANKGGFNSQNVNITFSDSDGSYFSYINKDGKISIYKGNKFTVSVNAGYYITSIEFDAHSNNLSSSIGFFENGIWKNEGDDKNNKVIFTYSASASNWTSNGVSTIIVNYAPAAPAVPEIVCEHEIVDGKLTVKAESTSMNFKKVEGIDIYYRLNGGKEKPATRACEDVAHSSWILHQGEDITLTNNHTLLEYLACNPETGVHSETKTIALEVGPTGVAEIEAAEAGEVRWFDMQGREVKGQPAAGVYVRVANGKAAKVIVK